MGEIKKYLVYFEIYLEMKVLLFILRIIIISILPTFLLFIAGTSNYDFMFNWINLSQLTLDDKKMVALILGLLFTGFIIPFENFILNNRVKRLEKFYDDSVVEHLKSTYQYLLGEEFESDFSETSIRLFLPVKNLRYYLPNWLGKRVTFTHYSLPGLFIDKIGTLEFTVFPEKESQGLVGKSFLERGISIRDGQANFQQYADYFNRMTDYQKSVAVNHIFVLTIPIIDEKNSIRGIVSVDSQQEIGLDKNKIPDLYTLLSLSRDIYQIYWNIYKK